jgi:NADH:ubiquinone oxidoreductase subunit
MRRAAEAPTSAAGGVPRHGRRGWTGGRGSAIVRRDEWERKAMSLLREIFTWWNGTTLGTRIWTARRGEFVGEDEAGNRFYQSGDGQRRWVIYADEAEASNVPPDWHGWLHHTYDEPPTERPLKRQPWEKGHLPNRTGTPEAYRPPGSVLTPEERPRAAGDYEAWTPE